MFAWRKWFSGTTEYDLYHPKERLLYTYWDGTKEVKADPMTLHRKMSALGPALSIDIKVSTSQLKDAEVAQGKVIAQIREIFSLKPLEEGGLTEIETLELLDHFMVYCHNIKKKLNPFQTNSVPSPSLPTVPSTDTPPATANTLDSGSASGEASIKEPMSSPSL